MLFARSAVAIKPESWNVVGLRGTGSDTYAVADLFVPARHAIVARASGRDLPPSADATPAAEPERREQGVLFRFSPTSVYQAGFSAVALGVARSMLASFVQLAGHKTPANANAMLRDNPVIQARIALSEARLASARAWLLQILGAMWQHCSTAGTVAFEHRIQLRLASTYAMQEAREVAETAYVDAGATAIFEGQPFERRMRDMHAVSQQVQASPSHFQSVGQHILGLEPNARFI
jgi:alkylation response protein AidB-like acyl-CoA dehydrogenase